MMSCGLGRNRPGANPTSDLRGRHATQAVRNELLVTQQAVGVLFGVCLQDPLDPLAQPRVRLVPDSHLVLSAYVVCRLERADTEVRPYSMKKTFLLTSSAVVMPLLDLEHPGPSQWHHAVAHALRAYLLTAGAGRDEFSYLLAHREDLEDPGPALEAGLAAEVAPLPDPELRPPAPASRSS